MILTKGFYQFLGLSRLGSLLNTRDREIHLTESWDLGSLWSGEGSQMLKEVIKIRGGK